MTERSWRPDVARTLLSLLLACGLGIGSYLAWHHENQLFGDATATLANCPESDTINCELVNTSAWSELFGVPIAAYAIPTYLLVLILVWGSRPRRPRMLSYAFCIGLLTSLASLFLLYISKTQIGFLCIWCMRLYLINVSVPILTAVAAWRSPAALVGETVTDLRRWPAPLRFTSATFAVLLALTVGAQQGYRFELKKRTAAEMNRIMSEGGPTVPASPDSDGKDAPRGNSPSDRDDDSRVPAPASRPPRTPSGTGQRGSTADSPAQIQRAGLPTLPALLSRAQSESRAPAGVQPGQAAASDAAAAQPHSGAAETAAMSSAAGQPGQGLVPAAAAPQPPSHAGETVAPSSAAAQASASAAAAPQPPSRSTQTLAPFPAAPAASRAAEMAVQSPAGSTAPPPQGETARSGAGSAAAAASYTLAGPVRRLTGVKGEIKSEPFDLQSRLGRGKPIALIFWAPGFQQSEAALADWAAFLKQSTPQIEVYAVAGRGENLRDEDVWELFSMMDLPADLPVLVDDGFKISEALDTTDVPNLTLFSAKGALVVAKIKSREQMLVVPPDRAKAEDIIRKVAAGGEVPTIKKEYPYYPATELFGSCAPSFTLKKFNTTEPYTFKGRSASGRPTMLVFWSATCKHCQIEIPNLVKWVRAHPNALDLVSVTHIKPDREGEPSHRQVTEAYIKSLGINWVVLEDPDRAVEDLYGSISTPTSYFITADGKVTNGWFYAHAQGFEEAMARELTQVAAGSGCRPLTSPVAPKMQFTVASPDGKRTSLASLIDKPSIVHFWATWCKPCVEELPSLIRFRDKLEKQGTGHVILVSVEDERAAPQIARFQKSQALDLHSYLAPKGGLADKLNLSYRVPRTFLLGPGGVVLSSRQGGQKWDDATVAERVLSRLVNGGAAAILK